nr:hypothetical protein [Paenibacillus kribbensis]
MTIGSQNDIDGLKEIGKIVALTISEMKLSRTCRNYDKGTG